ncbi:hypothetical protein MferCBS31731_002646 [Microsporum ferrugineum]
MGRDRDVPDWIGNMFDNYSVNCPDGSIWELNKKISEKSFVLDGDEPDAIAESQAVYHCRQTKGPSMGMEAIAKIRMQKLMACFAYHGDPGLRNIVYDEQENKCWFIDHESTFITDGPRPTKFYESEYVRWGLKPHVSLGLK